MPETTSRRVFLRRSAFVGTAILTPGFLAACMSGQPEKGAKATSTPVATTAAAGRRGPSKGELRAVTPFLPASLDGDDGSSHFNLLLFGVAETLMRFRADTTPEPWVASKLERVDPLTWKVTLRDDVTFWDGSKCDAEAVKASFERTFGKIASTDSLIPKGSTLTADGLTLTIKTPQPAPLIPKALATSELQIKKVSGADVRYTGPYRPTSFTAKDSIVVEAYDGYRGGPANIKTIRARLVPDAEARALALQAGDADVAETLVPTQVDRLTAAGQTVITTAQARQHMMVLNVTNAPFDDVSVRQAVALAVDREALAKLQGGGATAAYSLAPELLKVPGIVATQRTDVAEATKLLDAAGWKPGADGVREKAGKKLTFALTTYPGRAELEQFAVVIVDQMKKLGATVTIEKTTDIGSVINNSTFQATMYSLGQAAFTDIGRLLAVLYTPSTSNKNRYNNPKVNELFEQYLANADNPKAQEALKGIQDILAKEVPVVHLVTPPLIFGTSNKVKNLVLEPLNYYQYGPDVALA